MGYNVLLILSILFFIFSFNLSLNYILIYTIDDPCHQITFWELVSEILNLDFDLPLTYLKSITSIIFYKVSSMFSLKEITK
jgi:hypothetical protein